jgi:hypothetical protein
MWADLICIYVESANTPKSLLAVVRRKGGCLSFAGLIALS